LEVIVSPTSPSDKAHESESALLSLKSITKRRIHTRLPNSIFNHTNIGIPKVVPNFGITPTEPFALLG
jgi:hypothetical protein